MWRNYSAKWFGSFNHLIKIILLCFGDTTDIENRRALASTHIYLVQDQRRACGHLDIHAFHGRKDSERLRKVSFTWNYFIVCQVSHLAQMCVSFQKPKCARWFTEEWRRIEHTEFFVAQKILTKKKKKNINPQNCLITFFFLGDYKFYHHLTFDQPSGNSDEKFVT
jgi:hypothetical protein